MALSCLMIYTIHFWLTDKQMSEEEFYKHVGPAMQESLAELNTDDLTEPEKHAVTSLSQRLVFEESIRTQWVVGCAFFAGSLAVFLLGIIIILWGKVIALEGHIKRSKENRTKSST